MLRIITVTCLLAASEAWTSTHIAGLGLGKLSTRQQSASQLDMMFPDTAISVLAGSVAGALGVGVAFPLDTMKTKQQLKSQVGSRIDYSVSSSGVVTMVPVSDSSLQSTISEIWETQGLPGFYGGVQTSMLGQAVIKATAFTVNAAVLQANYDLLIAAATAGFVTAFLAVPIDRIKVLMQTDSFESESDCLRSVLETDGWKGLMTTGLECTLFREIPAYTLYFFLYGTIMSNASDILGAAAPAISGALAGAACVVPVHPVDVVKTIVQHSGAAQWKDVVADVYAGQGLGGFWDGLVPRMGRAAVNHAVTFAAYDLIVHQMACI
jgi:solute carrier family 25 carnitine/acylcarnitine transporter 20/29